MTDIELEPMTERHVPEIVEIERDLFPSPWSDEMFRQEVAGFLGSRPMVAVHKGRVIGYVIAWFFEEEVHLVNIAVRRDYQSGGVGKLLAGYVIEQGIKAGKQLITLEVRASNETAQAFYRQLQFKDIGIRKGYYTDNREDAVLMALHLGNVGRRREPDGKKS